MKKKKLLLADGLQILENLRAVDSHIWLQLKIVESMVECRRFSLTTSQLQHSTKVQAFLKDKRCSLSSATAQLILGVEASTRTCKCCTLSS